VAAVPVVVTVLFLLSCDWFDLVEDDGLALHQPLFTDILRQIRAGELPLWSPSTGCGLPLFARDYFGGFYPPCYLAHLICLILGLNQQDMVVTQLLHMGLASFTAFLYLRFVNVSRRTAALGAISFGINGSLLGVVTNWPNYGFWMPYLPLALIVVEQLVAGNRSWLWPCLGGLIGSLVYLASGPLGTFECGLLVGLYYLLRVVRRHLVFSLSRLAVCVVLTVLTSAGQMLATLEWLKLTERLPDRLTIFESLTIMSCYPKFYRGFFYPFVEWMWEAGGNWMQFDDQRPRFNGAGLFVGPLAPLALCLAVWYFLPRKGLHRALLLLLAVYYLLSIGSYWWGNILLLNLPFFSHYRWPVRWTPEFCAVAALLTGVGLELGWKSLADWRTRLALGTFLLVTVGMALWNSQSAGWPAAWCWLPCVWIIGATVLVYLFLTDRRAVFDWVALGFTVCALAAAVPGAQQHRWGQLKYMRHDPIPIGTDTQERVLYLANRAEQRIPHGEGCFAYGLPHIFGSRTVLSYGPFRLRSQEWQAGVSMMGELYDEDRAIPAFLQGHLLDTLRVGFVVVARDNARLNQACRDHPHLRWYGDYQYHSVYRHDGFRAPAFFIRHVLKESECPSLEKMGTVDLAQFCYIQDDYAGPQTFQPAGTVQDFVEQANTLQLKADTPTPQLLVITTTWYPGWKAHVDREEVPVYRVNGSFMAIPVPAGQHTVSLRFWPAWIVWLAAFNGLVLVVLTLCCGWYVFARLRR
jgi:hypothetical protein